MRIWICFLEILNLSFLVLHHYSITSRAAVAAVPLASSPSPRHSSHDIGECDALLLFGNSFIISRDASTYYCDSWFTNTSYPKMASWKNGTNCCSWDGVTCDAATNSVIGLDLSCSQLRGVIHSNSTLFSFPHLRWLNLAGNDFTGSGITHRFGTFTRMTHLNLSNSGFGTFTRMTHPNLSDSGFSDPTPLEVISSHLSRLVSLDLSCFYYGCSLLTIEDHGFRLFARNLTQLKTLVLDGTDMSRISPISLSNLSSTLTSLSLSFCALRGMFPFEVFHPPNLMSLSYLDLSFNNLHGFVDFGMFARLKNLQYLSLARNSLTVLLQSEGNYSFPKLKALDLAFCHLTELPHSLTSLKELRELDVFGNKIGGEIPEWLGEVWRDTLTTLDLSYNNFSGEIPSSICQLSSLAYLRILSTRLSGTIPGCLGNLSSLHSLFLDRNQLQGPLPRSLSNCTRLQELRVRSTEIQDTFPYWLNATSSLKSLELESNEFHGVIGSPLSQLEYLSLANNNFSGQLPRNFISLNSYADRIDLSNNNFEGPPPIPPPTAISYFNISYNKFSGGIPHQLCKATQLQYIDLSFNRLTGTIPSCFINFNASLLVLDLRANGFVGQIPEMFAPWNSLRMIRLSQNRLGGTLPRSLALSENLEVLDLSENELEDSFPDWLETFPNLEVLALRSNKFHGPVVGSKRTDHPFPKLHIFDISGNKFSGPLPRRYIANLLAMKDGETGSLESDYMGVDSYEYSVTVDLKGVEIEMVSILSAFTTIDFSRNLFEGEIPEETGDLKALKGLNFSHNNLSGSIPSSLANLTNLEALDLSSNKLNGEIPGGLAKLSSLSWLNLSNNRLVGQIPRGTQFDTFRHSFDGNPGLCGHPLPKPCGGDARPTEPSTDSHEEGESEPGIWIEWRAVPIGYGCGLMFGILAGYVVLEMRRPRWLARMVERKLTRRTNRQKKNAAPRNHDRRPRTIV